MTKVLQVWPIHRGEKSKETHYSKYLFIVPTMPTEVRLATNDCSVELKPKSFSLLNQCSLVSNMAGYRFLLWRKDQVFRKGMLPWLVCCCMPPLRRPLQSHSETRSLLLRLKRYATCRCTLNCISPVFRVHKQNGNSRNEHFLPTAFKDSVFSYVSNMFSINCFKLYKCVCQSSKQSFAASFSG